MKPKGSYGYVNSRRRYTIIRTVLYFAISAAIFIAGYTTTHTKANLLTIVAVLGVLPSAKSAVEAIMLLRARPVSEALYNECKELTVRDNNSKAPVLLYEIYLTTYDKNYPLDVVAITDDRIVALCSGAYMGDKAFKDIKGCEEHIKNVLSADGIGSTGIKVFDKYESFKNTLSSLSNLEGERSRHIAESLLRVTI